MTVAGGDPGDGLPDPGTVAPMEPRPRPEPFADRHHLFQLKWDGVRMLAFVALRLLETSGTRHVPWVRLQNRRLRDRTGTYPDLTGSLERLAGAGPLLLDGEVCVLADDGRPSFPAVLRRDRLVDPQRARVAARELPAVYFMFDLLYCDGESLLDRPLEERLQRLEGLRREPDFPGNLVLTQSYDDGQELFRRACALGLEGVVAKERGSPYVFGRRHGFWHKVKCRRRRACVVGGVTLSRGRTASLLVGAYGDGDADGNGEGLHYLGRVGSGLTGGQLRLLDEFSRRARRPSAPFVDPPRLSPGAVRWVEPALTVWVDYAEWTPELRLRAPSVAGFSDLPPARCLMGDP